MLPALRPGATDYTDPFTNFVPQPGTSVTDSLIESVFDLYYNPLLSVIGDEIVGLADIDSYGGLNDNANTGSYFFKGPAGLLGTGSGRVPQQSGLFHVRMEFDGQFQLPRAASQC